MLAGEFSGIPSRLERQKAHMRDSRIVGLLLFLLVYILRAVVLQIAAEEIL